MKETERVGLNTLERVETFVKGYRRYSVQSDIIARLTEIRSYEERLAEMEKEPDGLLYRLRGKW